MCLLNAMRISKDKLHILFMWYVLKSTFEKSEVLAIMEEKSSQKQEKVRLTNQHLVYRAPYIKDVDGTVCKHQNTCQLPLPPNITSLPDINVMSCSYLRRMMTCYWRRQHTMSIRNTRSLSKHVRTEA